MSSDSEEETRVEDVDADDGEEDNDENDLADAGDGEGDDEELEGVEEEGDDDQTEDNEDNENDANSDDSAIKNKEKQKSKKKGLKDLNKFKEDYDKRGVVFLARIPPYMKPAKIKHLLSQYGHIHRVYLAPEDPNIALKRKKAGGNRKKNFTEGWVEFADKRIAKRVAYSLNNTNIGGSKRNYYYDDLWNIKYLKDFKWHNLTEKIGTCASCSLKKKKFI
eukprot:TRINITY_DN6734_c0_g1_i1.p1 TRINITY_DN6734_c0_g1~~TRINITY_DN6734_c0_g1_i1.p1  ORF type:complete len:248 (-),score=60.70 TRINITY_DN6734_c0_g1_i1:40-699(-)